MIIVIYRHLHQMSLAVGSKEKKNTLVTLGLRKHASLLLKRPYRCTKCFIELPLAASLHGRRAGQGSWTRGHRHGLIHNVTSPASPGKVRR